MNDLAEEEEDIVVHSDESIHPLQTSMFNDKDKHNQFLAQQHYKEMYTNASITFDGSSCSAVDKNCVNLAKDHHQEVNHARNRPHDLCAKHTPVIMCNDNDSVSDQILDQDRVKPHLSMPSYAQSNSYPYDSKLHPNELLKQYEVDNKRPIDTQLHYSNNKIIGNNISNPENIHAAHQSQKQIICGFVSGREADICNSDVGSDIEDLNLHQKQHINDLRNSVSTAKHHSLSANSQVRSDSEMVKVNNKTPDSDQLSIHKELVQYTNNHQTPSSETKSNLASNIKLEGSQLSKNTQRSTQMKPKLFTIDSLIGETIPSPHSNSTSTKSDTGRKRTFSDTSPTNVSDLSESNLPPAEKKPKRDIFDTIPSPPPKIADIEQLQMRDMPYVPYAYGSYAFFSRNQLLSSLGSLGMSVPSSLPVALKSPYSSLGFPLGNLSTGRNINSYIAGRSPLLPSLEASKFWPVTMPAGLNLNYREGKNTSPVKDIMRR